MILGLVEPVERDQSLHEIGDEAGQTRLAHLLLAGEGDERREHLDRRGVALEGELQQAEGGRRELLRRAAGRARGKLERARRRRAGGSLLTPIRVGERRQ